MPGQIRITFKNFNSLDLSSARKVKIPGKKNNSFGEETMLRNALKITPRSVGSRLFDDMLNVASPPPARLNIVGTVPGAFIRSPVSDFTVTFGPTGSVGALWALGASGGIYFWNKTPNGEVGLFGSVSIGIIGNVGFGAGGAITYLFGDAPTALAGDAIVISVDAGLDVVTVSGLLILNAPPGTLWPPAITGSWVPQIIGVGFGVSAGLSALPTDVSIMPSRTWIKPMP
ncbi:MAG TPA: hypothetical protein VFO39_08000 [Candidatus Sulfotelmatobacter sp.]|nr:hypothetical protein [Candidatus Sulfotelmatobacter sp.]